MDSMGGGVVAKWVKDEVVLWAEGDDLLEWLQGQTTNDVFDLAHQKPVSFCFCSRTGQIESWARAWLECNGVYLVVPRTGLEAIESRFDQFVVTEDVELRKTPLQVFSVQSRDFDSLNLESIMSQFGLKGVAVPSKRSVGGGFDFLEEPGSTHHQNFDTAQDDDEQFEVMRILAGVPDFSLDRIAKTLPAELGPQFERDWVSYNKGCYLGQEVLMRMHSRGHANWTWKLAKSQIKLERGTLLLADEREVGQVTSSALDPIEGPVAAVRIRSEAAGSTHITAKVSESLIPVEILDFFEGAGTPSV